MITLYFVYEIIIANKKHISHVVLTFQLLHIIMSKSNTLLNYFKKTDTPNGKPKEPGKENLNRSQSNCKDNNKENEIVMKEELDVCH